MGTTKRQVNKQEGKVPETVTVKAEKQSIKDRRALSFMLSLLGMNKFQKGKGSKSYSNLKTSNHKHKSNKKRAQNKARATQARINKTW